MFYLSLPNPATSAISCTPTAGFLKTKQSTVNLVQKLPERETHTAMNFKAVCSRPDLEITFGFQIFLNQKIRNCRSGLKKLREKDLNGIHTSDQRMSSL